MLTVNSVDDIKQTLLQIMLRNHSMLMTESTNFTKRQYTKIHRPCKQWWTVNSDCFK